MGSGTDRTPTYRGSESGETLIEVLIALIVLSLGVVALMGGLGTAVFGSSLHRNQSDTDAALVLALETVKALPYSPCTVGGPLPTYSATPTTAPFKTSVYSSWGSYAAAPSPAPTTGYFVVSVQLWNGSSFSSANACFPPEDLVQLVTITAVSPGGRSSQTASVVKGNWS